MYDISVAGNLLHFLPTDPATFQPGPCGRAFFCALTLEGRRPTRRAGQAWAIAPAIAQAG